MPASQQDQDLSVIEQGLVAGGAPIKFLSTWAFCPSRARGKGVTIFWDSRIPYEKVVRNDATGRLAAVTLCGPSGVKLRVIGVYAPANATLTDTDTILLHAALETELAEAANARVRTLVLGDFNDVPDDDRTNFRPRQRTYPPPYSLISLLSCGSAQAATKHIDAFRCAHPRTHGATFKRGATEAARLDLIYTPTAWKDAFTTGQGRATCSPPGGKKDSPSLPFADHATVTVAVPFRLALGSTHNEVRSNLRRTSVAHYCLDTITSMEGKATYHAELLGDLHTAIRHSLAPYAHACKDQIPPPSTTPSLPVRHRVQRPHLI